MEGQAARLSLDRLALGPRNYAGNSAQSPFRHAVALNDWPPPGPTSGHAVHDGAGRSHLSLSHGRACETQTGKKIGRSWPHRAHWPGGLGQLHRWASHTIDTHHIWSPPWSQRKPARHACFPATPIGQGLVGAQ